MTFNNFLKQPVASWTVFTSCLTPVQPMGWLPHAISIVARSHPFWMLGLQRVVLLGKVVEPRGGGASLKEVWGWIQRLQLVLIPVHSASCSCSHAPLLPCLLPCGSTRVIDIALEPYTKITPSPTRCFCQGVFLQNQNDTDSPEEAGPRYIPTIKK